MTAADQHDFLSRVRRALGHDADSRRRFSELLRWQDTRRRQALVKRASARSRKERLALLDTLAARCRLSNIGIRAGDRPEEAIRQIAAIIQGRCGAGEDVREVVVWGHPLLEGLNLTERLPEEGVNANLHAVDMHRAASDAAAEHRQRARFRRQVVSADIGITSADYCLADSATLVIAARPGRPRAVSLVPAVHIAVITARMILADLQELYAILGESVGRGGEGISNCMTLISGPSTTRDIEAIPVSNAQGPGELHVVVITGGVD